MTKTLVRGIAATAAGMILAAGCAGMANAATPSPTPSPSASTTPAYPPTMKIEGTVIHDVNKNYLINTEDKPVAGAVVRVVYLKDVNALDPNWVKTAPLAKDANGNDVQPVTTGPDGKFLFDLQNTHPYYQEAGAPEYSDQYVVLFDRLPDGYTDVNVTSPLPPPWSVSIGKDVLNMDVMIAKAGDPYVDTYIKGTFTDVKTVVEGDRAKSSFVLTDQTTEMLGAKIGYKFSSSTIIGPMDFASDGTCNYATSEEYNAAYLKFIGSHDIESDDSLKGEIVTPGVPFVYKDVPVDTYQAPGCYDFNFTVIGYNQDTGQMLDESLITTQYRLYGPDMVTVQGPLVEPAPAPDPAPSTDGTNDQGNGTDDAAVRPGLPHAGGVDNGGAFGVLAMSLAAMAAGTGAVLRKKGAK